MFVLRRVSKNGRQRNQVLGRHYSVVYKETNKEEFKDYCNLNPEKVSSTREKEIYAIIVYSGDTDVLYNTDKNYIMTGDGKTFENVSQTYTGIVE